MSRGMAREFKEAIDPAGTDLAIERGVVMGRHIDPLTDASAEPHLQLIVGCAP